MRIILYTGKGGVGKTTIAAASALATAREGLSTLLMSTDRAHSLSDVLERELKPDPIGIATDLDALELDVHWELKRQWGEVRKYLRTLFTATGARSIVAEEIAVLPGIEELSGLLRLQDFAESDYDVIVVDCAPTGATLRLLSIPEVAEWYMRRLFKIERAAVRTLKPVADRVLSIPLLPEDDFYASIEVLYGRLQQVQQLLTEPGTTTIRPVTIPEKMVIEETRRLYGHLCLYDFAIDALIVNQLYPEPDADGFARAIYDQQQSRLGDIERAFGSLPRIEVERLSAEAVGTDLLGRLAGQISDQVSIADVLVEQNPVRIDEHEGVYVMTVDAPFADRDDVDLLQHGEELVIQMTGMRRNLLLPRILARRQVERAQVRDGSLQIYFRGEPDDET